MRVLILALSVMGILVSADAAKAGLITATREAPASEVSASIDPAIFTDEASQQTEDQIGLDKARRREVQRRLTRLGFDTRIDGKFSKSTRAVITRWQAARGYPQTGYLSTLQHQALLSEAVSVAQAGPNDEADGDRPERRRGGGRRHRGGGGVGGPVGAIGGMIGGLLGRR